MTDPRRAGVLLRSTMAGAAALLVAVTLCAPGPVRPAPVRAQAAPVASDRVPRERLSFRGADEPHTPAALNRVDAYRYAPDLTAKASPDVVLVLVPGLNSGPNTLDLLARDLVASDSALEVWVAEPRAGLLQDRRGVTAALANRDPNFALGYYYGGLAIDGQKFTALDPKTVPSAAYWGLDLHLRDIRVVIGEVHKRFPSARVLLGGHS